MIISNKREYFFKQAAIVFFVCFFICGCIIFKDYGVSCDELSQRGFGFVNYDFITTGNSAKLFANGDRYYGPVFQIFLYAAEKCSKLTEPRKVFLIRHFFTFLTFFIATVFFYLLSFKTFKNRGLALLCTILLVASPRIFADSFYNSKDLPTLSFFIIAAYTMVLFIEKPNIRRAILHAALCGLVIDTRVVGVLLPVVTVYLFLFQHKNNWIPLLTFISSALFFIILFWPLLWSDPLNNFIVAFKHMSNYPVKGSTLLYMGKDVPVIQLPWHYILVWILMTTPICYSILFFIGVFFLAKNAFYNFTSTLIIQSFLLLVTVPLLAVIVLHSSVYDGWRHLFFIYPFFLLIAVYGFYQLIVILKNDIAIKLVVSSTVLSIVFVFVFMITNHPFQNVYFNAFAGKNIRQNFVLDYWGLSYKQGYEYILTHDKSEHISIATQNYVGKLNYYFLPAEEKPRVNYSFDPTSVDYFITEFRGHPADYNSGKSVFQIIVEGEKIMEVFKLK